MEFVWAANILKANGILSCTAILRQPRITTTNQVVRHTEDHRGSTSYLDRPSRMFAMSYLDNLRDWGWTAEYLPAIILILQSVGLADYPIASDYTTSLRQFDKNPFAVAGLGVDY